MKKIDTIISVLNETPVNQTDEQEQLLITWAEKASGYAWLHTHSVNYFKHRNSYTAWINPESESHYKLSPSRPPPLSF